MSEDPSSPQGSGSFFAQTETPSTGEGPARPHRRRRRRRRRGGGRPPLANGAPERSDELAVAGPERPVEGVLFLPPRDNAPGVLVSATRNYLPIPTDPLAPRDVVVREGLEAGAMITGIAVDGSRPVLKRVEKIEGLDPAAFRQRPNFNELISIDPHDHLNRLSRWLSPNGVLQFSTQREDFIGIAIDHATHFGQH